MGDLGFFLTSCLVLGRRVSERLCVCVCFFFSWMYG